MASNKYNTTTTSTSTSSRPSTFVTKGLFPCAQAGDNKAAEQQMPDSHGEDLASLQLHLAPSTLQAIFSAQQPSSDTFDTHVTKNIDDDSEEAFVSNLSQSRKRKTSFSKSEDSCEDSGNKVYYAKKKQKKEHHKKNKKKHKKKDSRKQSEESDIPFIPKGKIFLEEIPNLKPEHAFHLDRKANMDLWHYQSVSKLHIPKYKQHFVNCFGNLQLSMKETKCSKSDSKKRNPRYFGKNYRRRIRVKAVLVTSQTDSKSIEQGSDFIHLPEFPEKIGKSASNERGTYSCLDEATRLYSQGKGSECNNLQAVDNDNLLMDEIFQKVAIFNQKIREEPNNIQQWLDFVEFQDIVAQEDTSFKREVVRLREVYQPSRSVIEKKLAILEKALASNPSSLELKLVQLELYQDVWESEKLERAWEDLLFVHSANVDVWYQYLSRQQSCLSRFTFSRVVKLYQKCFKTLRPILDGQVKVLNKPANLEKKMVDLFSQYCEYLHQCGYTERAISSYQALIEFNLYCPTSLNLITTTQRANVFEEFWESGVAKFGESGAEGWARWMENKSSAMPTPSFPVSTDDQEDVVIAYKLPKAQTWLALERIRQAAHQLPWRPDSAKGETEESLEDLDRLVLIDDIAPALFTLYESNSCVSIVCLLVKFLGLTSEKLQEIFREEDSSQRGFLQFSLTSLQQIPDVASLNFTINVGAKWMPGAHLISFLHNILQQAESYFGVTNRTLFTLLRLELELRKTGVLTASELSKGDAKEVKKFGKSILKESQNRNNLLVWDAYIRLQWACSDKMSETVSMIEVALGMFMGASSDLERDLGLFCLCRTYSQIMLNFEPLEHVRVKGKHSAPSKEDKHLVMACLGALVENKSFKTNTAQDVKPAFILRIQKRFQKRLQEIIETLVSTADHPSGKLLTSFSDCYALFEYCNTSLKSASAVFSSTTRAIKNQLKLKEDDRAVMLSITQSLYLAHIALVTNAMHVESVPLTEIRGLIVNALEDFPESTQLHSTLIAMESGSYIVGRLRRYFEKRLRKPKSVLSPLFAVASEMLRHHVVAKSADVDPDSTGLHNNGTIHRVRSVCEQVLLRPKCRHCPLLWRLYLSFEAKWGTMSRTKGILYRGLQSCPWVKELYLDGVSIFGDAELQEMTDLMTEKEIRVRMPPEEADLLVNAENDGGEMEEESEMKKEDVVERQRLEVKQETKKEDGEMDAAEGQELAVMQEIKRENA